MKKVDKLKKTFLESTIVEVDLEFSEYLKESEKIELDNLDWAKLVLTKDNKVMVENEHCTLFDISELSNTEMNIFLDIL